MKVQKMALLGVLTAAAIVIAILESFIPSIGIPGVKMGLANIVILIILYELGIWEAGVVNLLRVLVVSLVRGTFLSMGFLMSLTGAALSFGIMVLFYLLIKKFSIIGVSFFIHFDFITFIFAYIFLYLPIIAISAIITGVFVGITAKLIIKTGIIRKQREKYNF